MSGGEICIEGDTKDGTGAYMYGGETHITGNAGDWTGSSMSDGTLRIDGDVDSFSSSAFRPSNKGTIIWKGETIWKDGSFTATGLNMRVNPFAKNKIKFKNE